MHTMRNTASSSCPLHSHNDSARFNTTYQTVSEVHSCCIFSGLGYHYSTRNEFIQVELLSHFWFANLLCMFDLYCSTRFATQVWSGEWNITSVSFPISFLYIWEGWIDLWLICSLSQSYLVLVRCFCYCCIGNDGCKFDMKALVFLMIFNEHTT